MQLVSIDQFNHLRLFYTFEIQEKNLNDNLLRQCSVEFGWLSKPNIVEPNNQCSIHLFHNFCFLFHSQTIGSSSRLPKPLGKLEKKGDAEISYLGTVPGQRGKPKLVLNGYTFIPNKRINEKTYWNCSQVRQKKCKARIITVGSMDNILIKYPTHSHSEEFNVDELTFDRS